jgi:uncharacterized protein (DUF2267 family)
METEYDRFIKRVQDLADIQTEEQALEAIRATLETLSDHLTGGQAEDLAGQLPGEFSHFLQTDPQRPAEAFTLDEFYRRVSEREGVDLETAIHHARAVMRTIGMFVDRKELHDTLSQLPRAYLDLFTQL